MSKITIQSSEEHPGNSGNLSREITVYAAEGENKPVKLTLTNYWDTDKTYDFNISREAAIELMLALDLVTGVDPIEDVLEEGCQDCEDRPCGGGCLCAREG